MVGGDPAALVKAQPVLEAMGQKIFHVGNIGCGNVAKLVNNLIGLACGSITAEGFVLGVRAGIDPRVLYDIIKVSTGRNWNLEQYPQTVFKGNFEPGFKITLAYKDINLACRSETPLKKTWRRPWPLVIPKKALILWYLTWRK
jgi:3-hydroxyisobutyrate dehydrogenase-like beta-hydroxyacid dehydrogenase